MGYILDAYSLVLAYTVGSTTGYARWAKEIDQGLYPPTVTKGKAIFVTYEQAQECLDKYDGNLPPDWVQGRTVPASVFVIELPGTIDECCTQVYDDDCPFILSDGVTAKIRL